MSPTTRREIDSEMHGFQTEPIDGRKDLPRDKYLERESAVGLRLKLLYRHA